MASSTRGNGAFGLAGGVPVASTLRLDGCTMQDSAVRGCPDLPAADARGRRTPFVSPRATVLVVDDEPDVREVLEDYFVTHGYAVLGAESAGAAKILAADHVIDVALVDIHMPGEDGLSLARHLRERYSAMAIVMLTSAATVVDRIVGLEM